MARCARLICGEALGAVDFPASSAARSVTRSPAQRRCRRTPIGWPHCHCFFFVVWLLLLFFFLNASVQFEFRSDVQMAVRLAPCLRPAASRNARAVAMISEGGANTWSVGETIAGSLWAPPDIMHRPFQNKTPAYRFFFFCETKVFLSPLRDEQQSEDAAESKGCHQGDERHRVLLCIYSIWPVWIY